MEVIVSRPGIPCIPYIGDNFSLLYRLAGYQTISIALQMGVIEYEFPINTELIDGRPASFALKEFYDLAIRRSQDRCARRRRNIDSVMDPPLRTRIRKRVQQLICSHASHRNNEFQDADKTICEYVF